MGWDTMVSPDARFRGICIRARASYPPCRTSNDASLDRPRSSIRGFVRSRFVSFSSSFILGPLEIRFRAEWIRSEDISGSFTLVRERN